MIHSVIHAPKINVHHVLIIMCYLPSHNLVKNAQIPVIFVIRISCVINALNSTLFPMDSVWIALITAIHAKMLAHVNSVFLDILLIIMVFVLPVLIVVNIVRAVIHVKFVCQDFFWINKAINANNAKCLALNAQDLVLTVRSAH